MTMTTMSDFILPPSVAELWTPAGNLPVETAPEAPTIQPADQPAPDATVKEKNLAVPEPTGWKVLCIVPDVSDKFDGSVIVKADTFMKQEETATTVLYVLKVGPLAYKDATKFPDGKPWCKEGDFVLVRTYSGTRFRVFGKEMRLLNDDQIDAVVEDPRGVTRV